MHLHDYIRSTHSLARRLLVEPCTGRSRRLIVLLLLLGHLSLASNALTEGHWTATESHHHASLTAAGGDADPDIDTDCDHGCHAVSHLLAILHRHALYPGNAKDETRLPAAGRLHSYSLPPPKRPPKRLV